MDYSHAVLTALDHAQFTGNTAALPRSGTGAAICQRLAKEGARVLVADIDEAAAAATCKSVQMAEHKDICMSCQVCSALHAMDLKQRS